MAASALNRKVLTSLTTLTSFVVMTITGLVLYFVPQGRVAYWVNWKFIGLTKTDWGNIHIISSIVFAATGGFHIYFNWKPLVNYLSGRAADTRKYRRELATATAIALVSVAGAILLFPPFNYVIDFSGYLKQAWVKSEDYEPPFGHAEEVSLKVFAKKTGIDIERAVRELREKGIRFDSADEKLKDMAAKNSMAPLDIYLLIKKYQARPPAGATILTPEMIEERFAGSGIGHRKLSWILKDAGLSEDTVRRRLAGKNIEFRADATLKEIAARHGMTPMDVLKVILPGPGTNR